MAAVERMSTRLHRTARRIAVGGHETGSSAKVDQALGEAGASVLAHDPSAESAVKSHLSAAFPKPGVLSRSEAVAAILDPQTGLGTGILAISPQERQPVRALRRLTAATEQPGRDA